MSSLMCICKKMAKLVSHASRPKVGDTRLQDHTKKGEHRKKNASLYEPCPGPKRLTLRLAMGPEIHSILFNLQNCCSLNGKSVPDGPGKSSQLGIRI